MSLLDEMTARISAGLQRKSITRPSRWAETYRVMGGDRAGPWTFKYYPWLRAMHDSEAKENCCQKAAQMGVTETLLNIAFFTNDVRGADVLYLLPNQKPDASDFSKARFDAALSLSPHLRKLYSDVNNVGHKMAGSANFYLRGSQSKSAVKSVPAAVLLMDEVEEFNQDNIPQAYERLSGQIKKLIWAISTASLAGFGINKIYELSSKEHFFFKCPHCSKHIELQYPSNLIITAAELDDPKLRDSHLICDQCKHRLSHENKYEYLASGIWVPSIEGREDTRGFHINQLYSSTVSPYEMARAVLISRHDPAAEQELYNSKLGLTHTVDGARVSDADIEGCMGEHLMGPHSNNKFITMGVDQGKTLNYEICEWTPGAFKGNDANTRAYCRVLEAGTTQDFSYLDDLMFKYRVLYCVIDAHPERRAAYAFSQNFFGHVSMCFYGNGVNGKQIHINPSDTGEPMITVDRTSWLDLALGRFKGSRKGIALPRDVSLDYKKQIMEPARVYRKDQNGNPVGRYQNEKADHYAHARCYAEIAFALAVQLQGHKDLA